MVDVSSQRKIESHNASRSHANGRHTEDAWSPVSGPPSLPPFFSAGRNRTRMVSVSAERERERERELY